MQELRRAFTPRFTAFLAIMFLVLLWWRPETLLNVGWLSNDDAVITYLQENVETDHRFIKLGGVVMGRRSVSNEPSSGPTDLSFYRPFSIYKYDPAVVAPKDNFRIDGYVNHRGRIEIYGHVRGEVGYV